MFTKAITYVKEFIENRNASGAVALIGSKDQVWGPYPFGHYSFFPEEDPLEGNTIFDVASLSKVVSTTTLALKLIETGELALQHTIGDFVADAPRDKRDITMAQLLSHTSGIPAEAPLYESPLFNAGQGVMQAALALPLNNQPGQIVEYSCIGYIILGKIIEQISGSPLDRLFTEEIARPLEMYDTGYNLNPTQLKRTAYTEWDPVKKTFLRGIVHDENARALQGISGNAGLFSSAADLGRFCQMLLNGGKWNDQTILREESVALLNQDFTHSETEPRTLGWLLRSNTRCSGGKSISPQAIGHTGYTGTSIWIDFSRGLFAVLLTNRVHPVRTNLAILRLRPRFYDAVWEAYDKNQTCA